MKPTECANELGVFIIVTGFVYINRTQLIYRYEFMLKKLFYTDCVEEMQ